MSTRKLLPARRVHTGDRLLDDAQLSAQESARRLNGQVLGRGVLIHAELGQPDYSGLSFTISVARTIAHGLGRKAIGWFEVYGPDLNSARVGLRPTSYPSGLSSATHVSVLPAATGKAFLFIF